MESRVLRGRCPAAGAALGPAGSAVPEGSAAFARAHAGRKEWRGTGLCVICQQVKYNTNTIQKISVSISKKYQASSKVTSAAVFA